MQFLLLFSFSNENGPHSQECKRQWPCEIVFSKKGTGILLLRVYYSHTMTNILLIILGPGLLAYGQTLVSKRNMAYVLFAFILITGSIQLYPIHAVCTNAMSTMWFMSILVHTCNGGQRQLISTVMKLNLYFNVSTEVYEVRQINQLGGVLFDHVEILY